MGDGLRDFSEFTTRDETRATTCADGTVLKGVDISKWQGNVDWDRIAGDGVSFAFVRVSDGLGSLDQKFDRNWENAREAGIYTGVYQFFRPNQSVLGQADYLLEKMGCDMVAKTCPWTEMDLPPVIDVEYRPSGWSKNQMRNAIRTWIDRVEEFGAEPIVYSGRYFWRDYVGTDEWSDHPFWIAHYTNNCPNIPDDWSDWDFWQYTDSGSVSGVNGNTDMNQFNGTLQMLQALRPDGGGNEEPPPACGWIAADAITTIDDSNDCFGLNGPDQYWRSVDAGHNGGMSWTNSTASNEYNFGIWELNFDEGGSYDVQVYVDRAHTEATRAIYEVSHGSGTENVTIDQTDGGWIDLGTFNFDAGQSGQQIKLSDKTGQSGRQLAFDAIRLVPEGVDDHDCGDDDAGPSPRTDLDLDEAHDRGEALSCRSGGTPFGAFWLLLLLLPLRRRR